MHDAPTPSLVELPPDHPDLPVKPPLVFIGALLVGLLVDWFKPMPARPDRWGGLGIIFCAMPVGLVAWAWLTLKRHRTDVRPWKPTTAIVTDGPYALTRNPIYLGNTIALAAMGFAFGNLWYTAAAAIMAILLHRLAIRREEAHLAQRFGQAWQHYAEATSRWLFF